METRKFGVKHEFLRYLISGLTAVATDLTTYTFLLPSTGPSPAKTVSFITATVVAYALNKFYTFKRKQHSWNEMMKFGLLYSVSLVANVAVNRTALFVIEFHVPALMPFQYQFSWLMATGTSTVVNYVGQKFWVFRRVEPLPESALEQATVVAVEPDLDSKT